MEGCCATELLDVFVHGYWCLFSSKKAKLCWILKLYHNFISEELHLFVYIGCSSPIFFAKSKISCFGHQSASKCHFEITYNNYLAECIHVAVICFLLHVFVLCWTCKVLSFIFLWWFWRKCPHAILFNFIMILHLCEKNICTIKKLIKNKYDPKIKKNTFYIHITCSSNLQLSQVYLPQV